MKGKKPADNNKEAPQVTLAGGEDTKQEARERGPEQKMRKPWKHEEPSETNFINLSDKFEKVCSVQRKKGVYESSHPSIWGEEVQAVWGELLSDLQ